MPDRLTPEEVVTRAATALGKIELYGARGVTLVSFEEIEAMACLLADQGLPAAYPGAPAPKFTFTTTRNKEPQNV